MQPSRILLTTALLSFALSAGAADWPQWRGPERNGVAPEGATIAASLPPAEEALLWETRLIDGDPETHASPAIADGRVYVHTATEVRYEEDGKKRKRGVSVLACLALEDGSELWRHEPEGGCHDTPVVADGRVFYVGGRGTLYCLGAERGEEVWTAKVHKKNGTDSSPVVVGDAIVVLGGGDMKAFAVADGAKRWEAEVDYWKGSPAVWRHGGRAYVIAGNRTMSCVDAADGSEVWTLEGSELKKDPSSPAIHGDLMATMFEGAGLRVHRLTPDGAELLAEADGFEAQGGGAHQAGSPVFDGLRVWGVDGDKTFCYDVEAGEMVWTADKGDTHHSPILVDGKLIVCRKRGTRLYDAATGELLGENEMDQIGCSSFALADGRLVANGGGIARCWDLSD